MIIEIRHLISISSPAHFSAIAESEQEELYSAGEKVDLTTFSGLLFNIKHN